MKTHTFNCHFMFARSRMREQVYLHRYLSNTLFGILQIYWNDNTIKQVQLISPQWQERKKLICLSKLNRIIAIYKL